VTVFSKIAEEFYSQYWCASFAGEKKTTSTVNSTTLEFRTQARIDNSFHFIMLDQPERFSSAVEAFLNK
jgi:pimeloyl-ACP methyl ester carboxylesterase